MYPRRWDGGDRHFWEYGQPRANRSVCAVKLVDVRDENFTLVQYTGPDAREVRWSIIAEIR